MPERAARCFFSGKAASRQISETIEKSNADTVIVLTTTDLVVFIFGVLVEIRYGARKQRVSVIEKRLGFFGL